jgi:hypothetical protein
MEIPTMIAKDGLTIQGDVSRNLIQMSYHGQVGVAEMKVATEEVMPLLAQMRRGFAVLTDLSGLDSMALECATDITKMMEIFKAKGLATVVRIIPDPTKDIGFNILSRVHYRNGVKVLTFQDAAEAERILHSLA